MNKQQEKQLRNEIKNLIDEMKLQSTNYANYVGYQIRRCAHVIPRIYFIAYNPRKGKRELVPSITVPQALEYFGIK